MSRPYLLFIVVCLLGLSGIYPVLAAMPDVVVRITPSALSQSESLTITSDEDIEEASIEILVKRAQFGSRDDLLKGTLVHSPDYDAFLCEQYYINIDVDEFGKASLATLPPYPKPDENNPTVMLVPRGECSFERKAYAAKTFYGANAIMIYDRLGARYGWNKTSDRLIFPQDKLDYECANGNSVMQNLTLDPPAYNSTQLDPLMGMTTTATKETATFMESNNEDSFGGGFSEGSDIGTTTAICNLTNTALQPCESQLCLVTTHLENSTEYPVCCAWDLPLTMPAADDAKDLVTDDIIAVWLTIRQSELILRSDLLSVGNELTIESRGDNSAFNATYIFMWMWGTLVMMVGAWYAAGDYRRFGAKLTAYKASEEKKQEQASRLDRRRPGQSRNQLPEDASNDEIERRTRSGKNGNIIDNSGEDNIGDLHNSDLESGQHSFHDEIGDRDIGDDAPSTSPGRLRKKKNEKTKKKKSKKKQRNQEVWSLHSLPPPERKRKKKRPIRNNIPTSRNNDVSTATNLSQSTIEEGTDVETTIIPARESGTMDAFEMTPWHVLGFVVMASLTLILLFFFKIYRFIFVVYGIGCAGAISSLIFNPLVATLIPKLGNSWVKEFNKPVMCGYNGFSVTSQLIAYTWAAIWIWFGITQYAPQTNAFFWLSLNIFGACFCILSVSVLKLNSIKIAAMLLVAIFFYDIFFVFITPFITGGASVMLDVATGSENPTGEDFCYKYPDDRACKGIGFLPMLFIFPQVNDYANGSVLLGLGDIVLPGFLIAFSARHDEASRLIGAHMTITGIQIPTRWYNGYFFIMLMAYSAGLFCAFVAVILMEQGQPALLYICPICLTTILIVGRKDLKDLWNGAKVFRLVDHLITKTERDWGKARMKRFAEKRRRENIALVGGSGNNRNPNQPLSRRSTGQPSEEPAIDSTEAIPSDHMELGSKDVYFGYEEHPGTRAFRSVVQEVAADLGEEEFKPEIYKIIKRKLKGRDYFKTNGIVWAEATKLETRKEIGRAYDHARGKSSAVLEAFDPMALPKL